MQTSGKKVIPDPQPRSLGDRAGTALVAFRTIRVRLLGLVALSVLLPSLLTGLLADRILSSDLRRQVLNNAEIRTGQLAERLSLWLQRRATHVRAFTSSALFLEEVDNISKASANKPAGKRSSDLNRYLAYLLQEDPDFEGLAVVLGSGEILAGQPEGFSPPFSESPAAGWESGATIFEVTSGGRPSLLVLQKVTGVMGGNEVFLAASLRVENFYSFLAAEASGTVTAYLVDHDGRIKGGSAAPRPDLAMPVGARHLLTQTSEPRIYSGLNGEPVIGSSRLLNEVDWFLVAEESQAQAFRSVARFERMLMFLTFITALVLLVPALRIAQTIAMPLEELGRVAVRIRGGEAGLTVKSKAGGELGDFISAFNAMSTSLHESMADLVTLNQHLRMMSITDPLTGRNNRRFMEDYLDHALKLGSRTGTPLALVMVDIDKFKNFNDTYGHIAGDEALRQLGDLLVSNLRMTDVVSRFGGEEFLICLNQADREAARSIAEKLRREVEAAVFRLKGHEARMTISLGVSSFPQDGQDYESLLDMADSALYSAKEAGRNRVCVVNEPIPSSATPQDRTAP